MERPGNKACEEENVIVVLCGVPEGEGMERTLIAGSVDVGKDQ